MAEGGVTVVEITMTVPEALDVIRQVRKALGDRLLLGAGTILDPETARAALLAGAEYLVSPTINLDVIRRPLGQAWGRRHPCHHSGIAHRRRQRRQPRNPGVILRSDADAAQR